MTVHKQNQIIIRKFDQKTICGNILVQEFPNKDIISTRYTVI
jgi:hypothetical protein